MMTSETLASIRTELMQVPQWDQFLIVYVEVGNSPVDITHRRISDVKKLFENMDCFPHKNIIITPSRSGNPDVRIGETSSENLIHSLRGVSLSTAQFDLLEMVYLAHRAEHKGLDSDQ